LTFFLTFFLDVFWCRERSRAIASGEASSTTASRAASRRSGTFFDARTPAYTAGQIGQALDLDGATSITGGIAWKIPEISKFYWDGDVGMVTMCGWMSKSRWGSLPKDIQETFRKIGEEEFPLMYDFYLRARGNATGLYDIFPKLGIKVTRPTAAELDKIQDLAKVDWEKHMKTLRKKGLPAQKVLDEWLRLNRYYEEYYEVAR